MYGYYRFACLDKGVVYVIYQEHNQTHILGRLSVWNVLPKIHGKIISWSKILMNKHRYYEMIKLIHTLQPKPHHINECLYKLEVYKKYNKRSDLECLY
jgi:hypothetical protein